MGHPRIIFGVVLLLAIVLPARGQERGTFYSQPPTNPSHIEIPPAGKFDKNDELKKALQQRLDQFKTVAGDRKQVEDAQKQLSKVRKIIDDNPEMKKLFDPILDKIDKDDKQGAAKDLMKLKGLFEGILKNADKLDQPPPEDLTRRIEDLNKTIDKIKTPDKVEDPAPAPAPAPVKNEPPPPKLTEEDMARRMRIAEWMLRKTQELESTPFGKSPLVRQAGRDIQRFARDVLMGGNKRTAIDDKFIKPFLELSERFQDKDFLSRWGLSDLPRVSLPSVPNLPRWRPKLPGGAPPLPSVRPITPTREAGGTVLAVLVVLALGLALWRLAAHYRPPTTTNSSDFQVPRSWPVRPEDVRTREDLVRAFEHLSLTKLGIEARSWNHREIAAALGGGNEEESRLARLLANLYEQARYAPASEPLPEEVLPSARQAFASLAGTTAS